MTQISDDRLKKLSKYSEKYGGDFEVSNIASELLRVRGKIRKLEGALKQISVEYAEYGGNPEHMRNIALDALESKEN